MLQKIPIISKNASNKNCLELNFQKKSLLVLIFISTSMKLEAPKIAMFEIS